MAYSYSAIQRYRVTARDGQVFEGHVFERPAKDRDGELWVYADIDMHLRADLLHRDYTDEIVKERPFDMRISPKQHVATVVDAAAVVPLGAALSLSDLEQRIK